MHTEEIHEKEEEQGGAAAGKLCKLVNAEH